jgi:transposase
MVRVRICIGKETVKALAQTMRSAYKAADVRLIKRTSVLLALGQGEPLASVADRHGVGVSTVYNWLRSLLVEGVTGLRIQWKGGRPSKLTATHKARLVGLLLAGPEAAGFASGCWNALLIQMLIEREFGVLYNVHYLAQLLGRLGFSFQKARFLADRQDEGAREEWLQRTWPELLERARQKGALILFGDEASFAQWGSLGYTWAPVGQQPVVKTAGKRKAYKVFGLIEFFSGRFFHQGIEGKCNADSYIAFLRQVLAQTQQPLFLIQDNAPYHRAAKVKQFVAEQAGRLSLYHLPSYSPDYNPIEFLWRAVKRHATHNHYFPTFTSLIDSVERELALIAQDQPRVSSLFGRYRDRPLQPPAYAA